MIVVSLGIALPPPVEVEAAISLDMSSAVLAANSPPFENPTV